MAEEDTWKTFGILLEKEIPKNIKFSSEINCINWQNLINCKRDKYPDYNSDLDSYTELDIPGYYAIDSPIPDYLDKVKRLRAILDIPDNTFREIIVFFPKDNNKVIRLSASATYDDDVMCNKVQQKVIDIAISKGYAGIPNTDNIYNKPMNVYHWTQWLGWKDKKYVIHTKCQIRIDTGWHLLFDRWVLNSQWYKKEKTTEEKNFDSLESEWPPDLSNID